MSVGLDYGTKIAHAESESTTSGLLVSMTQTMGVLFTLMLGWFLRHFGAIWAISAMMMIVFSGVVVTACIPKRHNTFLPVLTEEQTEQ